MVGKLVTLTAGLLVIGGTLLAFRQHRQMLRHEMTRMHQQMNDTRHAVWDRHVRIAERIEPKRLKQLIEQAELDLEPIEPQAGDASPTAGTSAAGSDGRSDPARQRTVSRPPSNRHE